MHGYQPCHALATLGVQGLYEELLRGAAEVFQSTFQVRK
jgi:hypothetical protein